MPLFHEHGDTVAMAFILRGGRPEKPDFDTTRGYTKELWEMTTYCWKEDPSDRPTVDYVLGVLKNAAGQWGSENGEVGTQSPRADQSSTPLTERSDLPTILEHENETATTASTSPKYLQSPVIETRVPDLVPLSLVPTPPVPSPSTTKETPSASVPPTSSKKKKIEPVPYSLSMEKGPKPTPAVSMGETKSVPEDSSRGEGEPKPITVTSEETKSASAGLTEREKDLKPTPATPKEIKSAPVDPPKDEEPDSQWSAVEQRKLRCGGYRH